MKADSQLDWANLYSRHLAEWNERLAGALRAAGLDSIAIFAGSEKTRFRDDQTYAFAVEAYFKAWVPRTDHPGSVLKLEPGKTPLLVLLREEGFWDDKAEEPTGFWVDHFESREESIINKAQLLAIGDRMENEIAAARRQDAAYR